MAGNTRIIRFSGSGGSFTLAVNPKDISVKGDEEFETLSFLNKGSVGYPGNPKPLTLSMETFLPDVESKFFVSGSMSPNQILKLMYKWKDGKKSVRITISGTRINHKFFIRSPVEKYLEGQKDVSISWSFIEDRREQLKPVSSKSNESLKSNKLKSRKNTITVPKYVKWKKGYTFWKLAKKYYNNGSYAKKIAKLNKLKNDKNIKIGKKIVMPKYED